MKDNFVLYVDISGSKWNLLNVHMKLAMFCVSISIICRAGSLIKCYLIIMYHRVLGANKNKASISYI